MITKEMKISEILSKYPQTLAVFLNMSPHFKKLENKFLRKALASRVTIEQAAKIANVDLTTLLFELNKSINKSFEPIDLQTEELQLKEKPNSQPDFIKKLDSMHIKTLDVRPIIDSGKDPFNDIMAKIKELSEGEILLLINSFEPIPLYSVLKKKGFKHWTIKENELFKVYFYKEKFADTSNSPPEQKLSLQKIDYKNVVEIDVRELTPPEPMMKILETLSQIDNDTVLIVHHHREPMMLYPKLEERGYEAISNKIEENYYNVIITKKRS
ncbi:MAG: DUF2249 domain-containing protein [Melioribacter sp.]|uniref:DUF2249 domain-containing protein n=2 Tax=unclassified Melioribacter TaxID=2627329 RepID=UPI003BEA3D3D